MRQLEAENRTCVKTSVFSKNSSVAKTDGLAIRALRADMVGACNCGGIAGHSGRSQCAGVQWAAGAECWWAPAMENPGRRPSRPRGRPFMASSTGVSMEGVVDLAPDTVVKTVTARVMDGTAVRAMQVMPVDQPVASP